MNVAELERNVRPGDCIIVRDLEGVVSDGIEWFSDGTVSHIAIAFEPDKLIEALAIRGVAVTPLSGYYAPRYKIYVKRLPEEFEHLGPEVAEFAWSKVGNRYDFSQVILDGVALLAGKWGFTGFRSWFGRKVFGWRDGWTCSELYSTAVWERVGINLSPKKDVRTHTPQDLLESSLLVSVFNT